MIFEIAMYSGETSSRYAPVNTQWTSQRCSGRRCSRLHSASLLSLWQYSYHRQSHGVYWKTWASLFFTCVV